MAASIPPFYRGGPEGPGPGEAAGPLCGAGPPGPAWGPGGPAGPGGPPCRKHPVCANKSVVNAAIANLPIKRLFRFIELSFYDTPRTGAGLWGLTLPISKRHDAINFRSFWPLQRFGGSVQKRPALISIRAKICACWRVLPYGGFPPYTSCRKCRIFVSDQRFAFSHEASPRVAESSMVT